MTTERPVEGGADARGDGDEPDALAAAEAAVRGGGDEATAICLRCFAPLEGAPTHCPNCGAGASRAATLGPSVAGGVDVGGPSVHDLPNASDGRTALRSHAIIWALGMVVIPMFTGLFADLARHPSRDERRLGGPPLLLVSLSCWTFALALLFFRRLRVERRRSKADQDAPDAF